MKFWDSSAITPLVIEEDETKQRREQYEDSPLLTVWYGTRLEVESALARKRREGVYSSEELRAAQTLLQNLQEEWDEVTPTQAVRDRAIRLLHTHPLRAADAFQLAAALIVSRESPKGHWFLTGDRRLREAAEREGFQVDS